MAIIENIDLTPEQRREVYAVLKKTLPNVEVWAYGSRVKWNARPNSDLDLVAFLPDEQKDPLFACREAFEESSLPFKVDLFSWNDIPENFQKQIKENYAVIQTAEKKIEWEKVKFADAPIEIIDGDRGVNYPANNEFCTTGYCLFLNAGNVTNHGFDFSSCMFISQEKDRLLRKGKLQRNDIVLTTRGTIGNVALYNDKIPFDHIRINSGMVIFRFDMDTVLPQYAYYYLISEGFRQDIDVSRSGSAQPQLPIRDIKSLDFLFPPLSEQKRIAGILSAFDDKIELNRKMCKTLEAMAQALFKSWFVDFEPVKAKIAAIEAGSDPELAAMMTISGKTESELAEMRSAHPEAYAKLAHTASLFPPAMVDTDHGEIPQGWNACFLRDVTLQITKRIGEKECKVLSAVNTGELVLSEEHFTKQVFSIETNKYILVEPNSYAYNPSRINIGSLGRNKFDFDGCVSPIYIVFTIAKEYTAFFDQFFASTTFRDEVLMRASGSVRQALNYSDFGQIEIKYPPIEVIHGFNQKNSILKEQILALQNDIQNLSRLRDNCLSEFFSNVEENE